MKAIILAGGKGTRLAPYTKILPKPLVPIGDMPILEVMIHQLKRSGVDEITLTVGHLANLLRAFFSDGSRYGIKIEYSYEEKPLGTVGPLSLLPRPTEAFFVTNGDVLTTQDLHALYASHLASGAIATIATHQRHIKIELGVIQFNDHKRVTSYTEKPVLDYAASMGIYVFDPRIIDYIPPKQNFDFPNLVQVLLAHGEKVQAFPFRGYWQDLGNPMDYEQAVKDFESMRVEFLGEE
jgi:NDP-sugar pyrophosphorylase family protein